MGDCGRRNWSPHRQPLAEMDANAPLPGDARSSAEPDPLDLSEAFASVLEHLGQSASGLMKQLTSSSSPSERASSACAAAASGPSLGINQPEPSFPSWTDGWSWSEAADPPLRAQLANNDNDSELTEEHERCGRRIESLQRKVFELKESLRISESEKERIQKQHREHEELRQREASEREEEEEQIHQQMMKLMQDKAELSQRASRLERERDRALKRLERMKERCAEDVVNPHTARPASAVCSPCSEATDDVTSAHDRDETPMDNSDEHNVLEKSPIAGLSEEKASTKFDTDKDITSYMSCQPVAN